MTAWVDADPARYAAERAFWLKNGFADDNSAGKVRFVGSVEVRWSAAGEAHIDHFKVRVTYPDAFPYRYPDVEFLDPVIRRSRHQSPAGSPCLFPPRDWDQHVPPSEVHKALVRWLKASLAGSFPRELALYELPEYFAPSTLSILVAPEGLGAFDGRHRGTFSLRCAKGRDIGVLHSVDGQRVADDLLDGLRIGSEIGETTRNGRWFRLSKEPPIVRGTNELVGILKANGHYLDVKRKPQENGFVGLVFVDSVLGEERFLLLDYSASGSKATPGVQGWGLRAPWTYVVSEDELFHRLEGIRDPSALRETNVIILGAGAIGSSLALDLTREGVGGLIVCDPDRLRPGNIMRHALDLFAVGEMKADAVETAIRRINPYAETGREDTGLTDPGVLENLMRPDHPVHPADIVVSAIGDDILEYLVSRVAIAIKSAPVLFVRTVHDGDVVRIILLRPSTDDACLECLRLRAQEGQSDFIDIPDSEMSPVFDAGCATAAQPGAGLASRQAAVLGAKRALDVLLKADGEANHWVWVDRAIPSAPEARLHQAETMYAARLTRHPDCSVCNADV